MQLKDLAQSEHFSEFAKEFAGDIETSAAEIAVRFGASRALGIIPKESARFVAGVVTQLCIPAYFSVYAHCGLGLDKHARTTVKGYATGKVSAESLADAHGVVLQRAKEVIASTAKTMSSVFRGDYPLPDRVHSPDPRFSAAEEAVQALLAATESDATFDLSKVFHHAALTFPGPRVHYLGYDAVRDRQLGVIVRYALLLAERELNL